MRLVKIVLKLQQENQELRFQLEKQPKDTEKYKVEINNLK